MFTLQLLTGMPTLRMPKDSDNSRPKRVATRPGTKQNSVHMFAFVWGTHTFRVQLPTRSRAFVARYGKTCLLHGVKGTIPPNMDWNTSCDIKLQLAPESTTLSMGLSSIKTGMVLGDSRLSGVSSSKCIIVVIVRSLVKCSGARFYCVDMVGRFFVGVMSMAWLSVVAFGWFGFATYFIMSNFATLSAFMALTTSTITR